MRNKQGFTLLEVMTVIVILAVLGVIVVPIVSNAIGQSKEQAYQTQIINIKNATSDWATKNLSSIPNEDKEKISLNLYTLISGGFIDDSVRNPRTGKQFSNQLPITIERNGQSYVITVYDDGNQDTDDIESTAPIIILNGPYATYVEINEEYVPVGYTCDTDCSVSTTIQVKNGSTYQTVSEVSTATLNQYQIIYEAINTNTGKRNTLYHYVVIQDTTPPSLVIPANTTISVDTISYDLLAGVSTTDNSLDTVSISVTSQLTFGISGTYTITYRATDVSGNTRVKKRLITVS